MTDPITVAVLQNRLNAIAEEMGEAMLRTAYSQILNSSRDFSIALIDAALPPGRAGGSYPGACWRHAVGREGAGRRGSPTPAPNDVYLLNDPYRGGSHLPDLTVFVPVFADRGA